MEAKGAAASWTSAEPWAADRPVRYRHRPAVDRSSQRAERRFLFSRAAVLVQQSGVAGHGSLRWQAFLFCYSISPARR